MEDQFIIVKHAGDHWYSYFEVDPKTSPVPEEWSAHASYVGSCTDMKPFYTNRASADHACRLANIFNPVGSYGVCVLRKRDPALPD